MQTLQDNFPTQKKVQNNEKEEHYVDLQEEHTYYIVVKLSHVYLSWQTFHSCVCDRQPFSLLLFPFSCNQMSAPQRTLWLQSDERTSSAHYGWHDDADKIKFGQLTLGNRYVRTKRATGNAAHCSGESFKNGSVLEPISLAARSET